MGCGGSSLSSAPESPKNQQQQASQLGSAPVRRPQAEIHQPAPSAAAAAAQVTPAAPSWGQPSPRAVQVHTFKLPPNPEPSMSDSPEELPKRITKEAHKLLKNQTRGFHAMAVPGNPRHFRVSIEGPEGCAFEVYHPRIWRTYH